MAVAVEILAEAAGVEIAPIQEANMAEGQESPADAAGRIALERMFACLDEGRSFRLEAGAGAGKTYSLERALRRLIEKQGSALLRQRQQIGCITYTNVAKDEIIARTNAHPAVRPETVHGFAGQSFRIFSLRCVNWFPGCRHGRSGLRKPAASVIVVFIMNLATPA